MSKFIHPSQQFIHYPHENVDKLNTSRINLQEKNEAMKKKILILATTVAVITILLTSFSLVKTGTRTATYSLPHDLSARVDHECRGHSGLWRDFSGGKTPKQNCYGIIRIKNNITPF